MELRTGNGFRFSDVTNREALLGEMIDREALYAKAIESGYDKRPEVEAAIKHLILSRFRDEEISKLNLIVPVTDQEIQTYYDSHAAQFATPAKVHAAMILLRIPATATDDKRAEIMSKAKDVLDEARAAATPGAFAELVQANSQDQGTRYRGGDLGWVSQASPPWGMDSAAVAALFDLQKPGDFAPLIQGDKGVYIFKLLDIRSAGVRPLNQVRESIRYSLQQEHKARGEEQFYAAMRIGLDIRTNRVLFDSIQPPSDRNGAPPSLPAVAESTQP